MKGEFRSRHRAGLCGRRGGSQASCLTYPPLRAHLPAELNAPTMGNTFGRSTTVAVMYCAFLTSRRHGSRPAGAGEAMRRERARTGSAEFSSNEQAAGLVLDTASG